MAMNSIVMPAYRVPEHRRFRRSSLPSNGDYPRRGLPQHLFTVSTGFSLDIDWSPSGRSLFAPAFCSVCC
jgi:hypothetical protein